MILTILGLVIFTLICIAGIHYISRAYSTTSKVNADDFNKIALALGAILTVAWAIFTYGALEQRDKAKAELTDLENRIKDTQSTSFSVTAEIINGEGFFYLIPSVIIKNNSNRAIYINLTPDSLKVTRVVAVGDTTKYLDQMAPRYYSSIKEEGNAPIYDVTVPIGAERKLSYLVSTKYPGMYYISFTANAKNSDGEIITKDFSGKPLKWFSASYIYVK